MSFFDSKEFNDIAVIISFIASILVIINIVHHFQGPERSSLSSRFLLAINIFILITMVILIVALLYRRIRSSGERSFDADQVINLFTGEPVNWKGGQMYTKDRDGNDIIVRRIKGDLYVNVENSNDFYECPDKKCRKEPPTDKFIRENFPGRINQEPIKRYR